MERRYHQQRKRAVGTVDDGENADHNPRGGRNGPRERNGHAGADGACGREAYGQHPVQQNDSAGAKAATAGDPADLGICPESVRRVGKAGERRGKDDRAVSDGHHRRRGNPQQGKRARLCLYILRAFGVRQHRRHAAGDHRRIGTGDDGKRGGGNQEAQRK